MYPLVKAIKAKDFEAVKALVKIGVPPEGCVLYEAVRVADAELVKMLIDAGANVNYRFASANVLFSSLKRREFSIEIFNLLLDAGADIDVKEAAKPNAAMTSAICYGYTDAVIAMLDRGADPNVSMLPGRPLICVAAMIGHYEVIQPLIDAGADVDSAFIEKHATALYTVCNSVSGVGDWCWLSDPSRINQPNRMKTAEILLKNGANTRIKNTSGLRPRQMAVINGFDDVAELILKHEDALVLAKWKRS